MKNLKSFNEFINEARLYEAKVPASELKKIDILRKFAKKYGLEDVKKNIPKWVKKNWGEYSNKNNPPVALFVHPLGWDKEVDEIIRGYMFVYLDDDEPRLRVNFRAWQDGSGRSWIDGFLEKGEWEEYFVKPISDRYVELDLDGNRKSIDEGTNWEDEAGYLSAEYDNTDDGDVTDIYDMVFDLLGSDVYFIDSESDDFTDTYDAAEEAFSKGSTKSVKIPHANTGGPFLEYNKKTNVVRFDDHGFTAFYFTPDSKL